MARYIDADELIRLIEIDALCNKPYSKRDALACVKAINTADVVPRAELAVASFQDAAKIYSLSEQMRTLKIEVEGLREINSLLAAAVQAWKKHYENLVEEIFEDIDRMVFGTVLPNECAIISTAQLAELKKKYTEDGYDG